MRIRIRIPGSIPLTDGPGSGSKSGSYFFLHWFKFLRMQKGKISFHIFLLITCQQAHHIQSKKFNFLLKFYVKILLCRHYFSPLNTSTKKGKDPEPDPYLWLMDPAGSERLKNMQILRIWTQHWLVQCLLYLDALVRAEIEIILSGVGDVRVHSGSWNRVSFSKLQ